MAKERIKIVCECGKKKLVTECMIKYGAKYCSQECYHKYTNHAHTKGKHWKLSEETKKKQGLHQLGEKNHNWKGGITNPRKNKENKKWARAVKKRDKFCVVCGNGVKIVAHHLNSFDIFPEERYNLDNGTSLCVRHHEEFHKKYGFGRNTMKQFEEFVLEKVESVEKIDLEKAVIYNISLEGDSPFYANGILTHNTPPHIIKPKNKKALKFEIGKKARLGKKGSQKNIAFAKEIKHPGTRPNPFIRNTIQQKIGRIIIEEISR